MTIASSSAARDLSRPGQNVGAGKVMGVLSEVVGERAAASRARGDDNLAAMARQKPDRRLVDLRREDLLRAAVEERDATGSPPLAFEHLRLVDRRSAWQPRGDERERGFQLPGHQPGEGRAQPRQPH